MSYMSIADAMSGFTEAIEGYLKEKAFEKVDATFGEIELEQMVKGYIEAAFAGMDLKEIAEEQAREAASSAVDFDDVARDVASDKFSDIDLEDIAKDAVNEHVDDTFRRGQIHDMAKEKVDDMVTDEVSTDAIEEWARDSAKSYATEVLSPKLVENLVTQWCEEHISKMIDGEFPCIPDMIKDSAERVILGKLQGNFGTMEELVQECIDRRLDYQLICDLVQRAVDNSKPIPKPSLWRRFLSWFSR